MFEKMLFTIKGVSPLLMHNSQLADPLNDLARAIKKISANRKKTDADYGEMSRLEWMGGLYLNESGRVIVPGDCIKAMLVDAAKKKKLGKAFKPSVFCFEDSELEYDGPKNIDKLWADGKFIKKAVVKIGMARIVRTRPMFRDWSLTFEIQYLPSEINPEQVQEAVVTSGRLIGLCDWRPVHGRFEVVETA